MFAGSEIAGVFRALLRAFVFGAGGVCFAVVRHDVTAVPPVFANVAYVFHRSHC